MLATGARLAFWISVVLWLALSEQISLSLETCFKGPFLQSLCVESSLHVLPSVGSVSTSRLRAALELSPVCSRAPIADAASVSEGKGETPQQRSPMRGECQTAKYASNVFLTAHFFDGFCSKRARRMFDCEPVGSQIRWATVLANSLSHDSAA